MNQTRASKKFKYSEKENAVLVDLFSRLPTLQLAYCVRGAAVAWREMVDNNQFIGRLLRTRAQILEQEAQKKSNADPFYDLDAIDDFSATALTEEQIERASGNANLQRCLKPLSAAQLQWDCERVFRHYRQTTLQPLANLCEYWENKSSQLPISQAESVAGESRKSHQELQMRVLHDCNDRSAERHVFRVRNEQQSNVEDQ